MRQLASLCVVAAMASCSHAAEERQPAAAFEVAPDASGLQAAYGPKVTADSILQTLTVREKVGQLIMPWLSGSFASLDGASFERATQWVDEFGIGGIIISMGSPLDAASKLNGLQRRSRLPLIVAADLEFGAAMRMIGATAFPMPMAIGATGRELDAYQMGRVTALEARAIGIHWTFSPVADINNNPQNPIINTRSFGEDPQDVAMLVAAYIRGVSDHGLYTTGKHFPGHGDTGTDSHIDVPTLDACWDRLDTLELIPFRAAIDAGVTTIMTAHVAMPCFEHTNPLPATLSPVIMTGVLRDSLGFDGLVVTDALTMGAIVARYGAGESAVRAYLAGSDLLLMPANLEHAVNAMIAAIDSGRISIERIDKSVRKLIVLKQQVGLFRQRTVSLDSIPVIVGSQAFQEIADDIAARALTLVQRGHLEATRAKRGRVAVITYAEETNLTIGDVLIGELRALGDTVTPFRLFPASGPTSYDSARTIIENRSRVIFASSVRPIAARGHVALPDGLVALIQEIDEAKNTTLVSFGSPYLLNQLPNFPGTYLLAWNAVPANERAVAQALSGGAPVEGRLPITLSEAFPRGYGITVPPQ